MKPLAYKTLSCEVILSFVEGSFWQFDLCVILNQKIQNVWRPFPELFVTNNEISEYFASSSNNTKAEKIVLNFWKYFGIVCMCSEMFLLP